nr:hypothetical protein OG781_08925 [Streptomyces sp. NBC_00830]
MPRFDASSDAATPHPADGGGMSNAVYGLVGALGGAAVAGAAAFWGPIQLQKRAQREVATEAAASDRADVLRAQVARVVLVRRAITSWHTLLARTHWTVAIGRPVDPEKFRQAVDDARDEASTALYEALNDGLHIPVDRANLTGSETDIELDFRRLQWTLRNEGFHSQAVRADGGTGDSIDSVLVLDVYDALSMRLMNVVNLAAETSDRVREARGIVEELRATETLIEHAHECRTRLYASLLEHVDRIADITTIEIRGSRGTEADAKPPVTPPEL